MIDIYEFKSLVDMVASSKPVNPGFNVDDVKQELWAKVVDMNNKGFFTIDTCPTKRDRERLVIRCLRNKLLDIIRHQSRRKDTSVYSLVDFSERQDPTFNILEDHLQVVSCKSYTMTAEEFMEYQDLTKLIKTYMSWQEDDRIIKFLSELLTPSKEVESHWQEIQAKKPRLLNLHQIPIKLLADYCGLTREEYTNITEELSRFLKEEGVEGNLL